LLAAVISVVGGYLAGVRTSRNERRDNALAEIFKEMALFYRYLVSWTDTANPDPAQPTAEAVAESSDIPARKHVNDQYRKFVLAFYGNAIWLDKATYDLIQEFSLASRDLLNELNSMRGRPAAWRLPDGTDPKDRRKEQITPKYNRVQNVLRAEIEASRYLIPFPIVIKKNVVQPRRTDPAEGE
jgi:hypothetical protein